MTDLAATCPAEWAKTVKPFLVRANEFDAKQPLVAYFLRTHAASVASAQPRSPATTKYLISILDSLEKYKAANAEEVKNADGRTVLTRFGLMMFSRADDLERAGQGDETVLKLFFSASQVLEATKQFMPDGKLDPVAEEKFKYARYIAGLIKKSMDAHTPYVSPNADANAPMALPAPTPAPSAPPAAPPQQVAYAQPAAPPQFAPPPPQYANPQPPAPQYAPQPAAPQPPPPQYAPQPAAPQYAPQPAAPQYAPQQAAPQYAPQPANAPMYQPAMPPIGTGTMAQAATQMDIILEAQKYTKQAISALQFYDSVTARQMLLKALSVLDAQR